MKTTANTAKILILSSVPNFVSKATGLTFPIVIMPIKSYLSNLRNFPVRAVVYF
jgi:hypothetical protein